MLKRWGRFTRFLDDGRICLTNNAEERALRGIALGRKSWLFCGSDRGGDRAAFVYTLIQTAKLNDVDTQARLADLLARIADMPIGRLDQLLPWNWRPARQLAAIAARSRAPLQHVRPCAPPDGYPAVYGYAEPSARKKNASVADAGAF